MPANSEKPTTTTPTTSRVSSSGRGRRGPRAAGPGGRPPGPPPSDAPAGCSAKKSLIGSLVMVLEGSPASGSRVACSNCRRAGTRSLPVRTMSSSSWARWRMAHQLSPVRRTPATMRASSRSGWVAAYSAAASASSGTSADPGGTVIASTTTAQPSTSGGHRMVGSSSSRLSETVSCSTGVRPAADSRSTPSRSASCGSRSRRSSGVDQREQLSGLVPAGAGGVQLDLAYDLGQRALRLGRARSSGAPRQRRVRVLDPACTSSIASSSVVTFTSRILSGSK